MNGFRAYHAECVAGVENTFIIGEDGTVVQCQHLNTLSKEELEQLWKRMLGDGHKRGITVL
jgi:hypothetical protein